MKIDLASTTCSRISPSVTSILISRFMLNLRGANTSGGSAAGSNAWHASVIGDLGAPLGREEERESERDHTQIANILSGPFVEYFPPLREEGEEIELVEMY